jgi:type IV fimbrial biogenesis protein FimT
LILQRFLTHSKQSGFGLLEILLVLVILGITLGIAVPAYQRQMDSLMMKTTANELLISHRLARSEAMRTRREVSICASGAENCVAAAFWNDGWMLKSSDVNRDREWLLDSGLSITANNTGIVRFNSQGALAAGSSDRLQLDGPATSRCLKIDAIGRTRIDNNEC